MSEVLLEGRGVHAWYGSSHVLHGIDLAIGAGESVGLLGRNGMGKTTLIRTLLGHVRERDGVVRVAGEDVSRAPPHRIAQRGIGYVPEGRGIFPNLTVHENLVMAARPAADGTSPWSLERVLGLFPRLALRAKHPGGALSGGEQQMVAIGRALMTQPRLLVLDEATEGLAPLIVQDVWRVIGEIRAAGIAALIVDRDYRRVAAHADRLVVLQKGQVALHGPARALLESGELAPLLGL